MSHPPPDVIRDLFLPHYPFTNDVVRDMLLWQVDPVRTHTVTLALETIERDAIPGVMAELGVWRGQMAALYQRVRPERRLYLFDTFEGFPTQDLEGRPDTRFTDTSLEAVKALFSEGDDVVFRKGYFPDTAAGLEGEVFSFAMLDADLYAPTIAGLEFFYPRMAPGGYVFLHDYTSTESNGAIRRACDEFMRDKPERIIEIPDMFGTALFRKS